jgi:hypothetical protein
LIPDRFLMYPVVGISYPASNSAMYSHAIFCRVITHRLHSIESTVINDGSSNASPYILRSFGDLLTGYFEQKNICLATTSTGQSGSAGETTLPARTRTTRHSLIGLISRWLFLTIVLCERLSVKVVTDSREDF